MAIKGLSYAKTTWAFEERPVASAKLNLWDDRIESALELMQFLAAHERGGIDGVFRGATPDDLAVKSTSPASLTVEVRAGYAIISKFVFKLGATTPTLSFAIPSTNPRKDVVQARLATWDISVKQGTEAASPVAPLPDVDALVLAEVYLRVGMTSVKDTDDGTNGYLIDVRSFV